MSAPVELIHRQVGLRIESIRSALGLSQEELAKRCKYTRATVASMETGRHRFLLDCVEEMAKALGTTPKNLVKGIWT